MTLEEAHKIALARYPIDKKDCRLERLRKEFLRIEYIKRLMNEIRTMDDSA